MKYYLPQQSDDIQFYTFAVVKHALIKAGHVIVDNERDADAVLVSLCDVLDLPELRRIRKETSKPIIAGGSFAFNYWSVKNYADIVWIGEIFDMADCRTLGEIADSPHAYTGTDKPLIVSTRIDWASVPVAKINKTKAYYWGGVGCKNKCRFCFTSWTHQHQSNAATRIVQAQAACKCKGVHLMSVANEYDDDNTLKTRDMLLRDYITRPITGASLVRMGVEFPTEETRRHMGKAFSDEDIIAAIHKADRDNCALRLFHITGYNSLFDWERYIGMIAANLRSVDHKRLVHLMFNNLQYQNYTPLYRERFDINPDYYIDINDTKRWYDVLRQSMRSVLVGAPSPFQHVVYRMGMELSRTREQAEYWIGQKNKVRELTKEQALKALIQSSVLDTAERRIDFKTGKIK